MARKKIVFVLITGILCGTYAKAEVQAGPSKVAVSVENEHRYNDNLYLSANGTKQDYYNVTYPKIAFELPMGEKRQHKIRLRYAGEAAAFAEYNANNFFNQDLGGDFVLDYGSFYIKGRERFRDTQVIANAELRSPTRIKNNNAAGTIGMRIAPFSAEFTYENYLKRYDHEINATKEFDKNYYTGTGYYDINKQYKAFCEYTYMDIDYTGDKDRKGYGHQIVTGLRARPHKAVTAMIKGGYVFSKYATDKGASDFIGGAELIVTPSSWTRVILSYDKNVTESTYQDINYLSYSRVSAQLTQNITKKLQIVPLIRYQNNKYPSNVTIGGITKHLVSNTVTGEVDLKYNFTEAFSVIAGYEYRTCLSNIDANEYKRNVYTLSARYAI